MVKIINPRSDTDVGATLYHWHPASVFFLRHGCRRYSENDGKKNGKKFFFKKKINFAKNTGNAV
ncbi:MAG: hypothetical protein N2449_01345 [Bacteroidales bacterium]|nr:hypothetical protein [Bacteroidales bacterium]